MCQFPPVSYQWSPSSSRSKRSTKPSLSMAGSPCGVQPKCGAQARSAQAVIRTSLENIRASTLSSFGRFRLWCQKIEAYVRDALQPGFAELRKDGQGEDFATGTLR